MKPKTNVLVKAIFLFTILFGLNFIAGCGGGSGGSDGGTISGVSQGQIEGFGSVIVNGVEWGTESVEVEIEGVSGFSESDLHEGMVIRVEGSLDDSGTTGTATKINFDDNLEGPISSVNISSSGFVKTLVVLAQTVIVEDGITFFDNNDPTFTFASLGPGNVGNVVEVSGLTSFDGTTRATFIEKKADDLVSFLAADDLEIEGFVSPTNFNPPNSFEINGLTIDSSGVIPRNGVLAIGVLVEVKGNNLVGNTLSATDVEVKAEGLGLDDIQKAEVEGFVTNLNVGAKTFEVNGQIVDFSTAIFIGGTEDELLDGIKVEAEGPIVGGELQADKIEFKESVKFEANVQTVNTGAGTLTLEGLPGITVAVDPALTEFENVTDLSGINIGNNLKIRGRRSSAPGTTVVATEVELKDVNPDNRAIIQGTVDSFVPLPIGDVTILGVVVDTSTINNDDFKDDDIPIGRTAFFNRLAVGDLVKARLNLDTGDWDQIEFED